MSEVCLRLDPADAERSVVRVGVDECDDGVVVTWLRELGRGVCAYCREKKVMVYVPWQAPAGAVAPLCGECVLRLVLVKGLVAGGGYRHG
jgi:hypothetical protein